MTRAPHTKTPNTARLLLVVAFMAEARGLIAHYQLKRVATPGPFPVYCNQEQVTLIISGSGSTQAAVATTYGIMHGNQAPQLFCCNVGIAGGHDPIGSVFRINRIDADTERHFPFLHKGVRLSSRGLHTLNQPSKDYQPDTLFDMEGAGFFHAASRFVTIEQIGLIKVVSDNPETPHDTQNKTQLTHTIESAMPTITSYCDHLLQLSAEEARHLPVTSELFAQFTSQWHFSTYQRHQLKQLLHRWHILAPETCLATLTQHCRDSRAVVSALTQGLSKLRPTWNTVCK